MNAVEGSNEEYMTTISSVATLYQSVVGAGALSLPYAFRQAGIIGSLLLAISVCLCEGFTLYVLSKFSERYGRQSYSQLVRANVGRKMSAALPFLLIIYAFGSCTAYLMITTDAFCDLSSWMLGEDSIFAERQVMMVITAYAALLPICLARTMGALVIVSSSAVFGFMYTTIVVIILGVQGYRSREPQPMEGIVWIKWDADVLYALPIIIFGFNSHTNIITIFKELKDAPDFILRRSSSQIRTMKMDNMIEVIVIGLGLVLGGYLIMGFFGYLGYPNVSSNILNDLPSTALVQGARASMAFIVLFTYPLTYFPAREGFEDAMTMVGWDGKTNSGLANFGFTFAFISGTAAVATAVTDLGIVLSLVGGTVASFLIFFVPGLMLVNEAVRKHSKRLLKGHTSSVSELNGMVDGCPIDADSEPLLDTQPVFGGSDRTALSAPLLERLSVVAEKGIKKSGLMYSPGKSWAAGVFLMSLSVVISVITVYTTLVAQ